MDMINSDVIPAALKWRSKAPQLSAGAVTAGNRT